MRLISALMQLGSVLAASFLVLACEPDGPEPGREREAWLCSEGFDSNSCACGLVHVLVDIGYASCGGYPYSCCLLTEEPIEELLASCECLETEDCEAEAASRRGATIVGECPPGSDPTAHCATLDENCRDNYLATHDLTGCCAGTTCRDNAAGIPVCQVPTDADLERERRGGL